MLLLLANVNTHNSLTVPENRAPESIYLSISVFHSTSNLLVTFVLNYYTIHIQYKHIKYPVYVELYITIMGLFTCE